MSYFLCRWVTRIITIVALFWPLPAAAEEMPEVLVLGREETAASSARIVPGEDFELRPQGRPADLIRLAPGLAIAQHAGGGKADQQFLRGFDSDHGTDVRLTLDGTPVNMRSHAHGQGYADLHFIIPETIEALEVTKGPYHIDQGDFATAGAVNFITRDMAPANFVQSGWGEFGLQRYLILFSPTQGPIRSLVAFEAYRHDGPFINAEDYDRYNGFAKATFNPTEETQLSVAFTHNKSDWYASGQIPLREIRAGRLDRFGAIDESEGGRTRRTTVNAHARWQPTDCQSWEARFTYQHYALDLYSNFTFFKDDPVNGDGIAQFDRRDTYTADLRYRAEGKPWGFPAAATVGFQTRVDDAQVRLVNQAKRNVLSTNQDADVLEGSYSPFVEVEARPISKVRLVSGVRADFFHYQVEDNKPGSTSLNGVRSDERVGVTANLILGPWANTEYFVNFGRGFHSNDARALILQPNLEALPAAQGAEVGFRTDPSEKWRFSGALWLLDLNSELVFVGDSGETEAKGRTRRYGWELGTRFQPADWIWLGGDVTWSHAEFTASGDAVERAPELVARADLTIRTPQGIASNLEMRHLAERNGVGDRSIQLQGYTIFDWTTRYRVPETAQPKWLKWLKGAELFVSIENLFDRNYREAQFVTETQLASESSAVQDITFSPGWPRTVTGGIRGEF